jgi:beta-lactamase superfamily II metal-dependent hydrolase
MRFLPSALVLLLVAAAPLTAQNLEIHTINVGWGASVLLRGPDGTTVLLDGGNTGKGTNRVVPYLQSIGIQTADGLDYVIAGHQHCDHIGGLDEVINAGYDVHVANYYNGSSATSTCVTGWNTAAASTTAGAAVSMPVGTVINLGSGATLTCIVRNGALIGGGSVAVSDENDRSIGVLVQYGGFEYIWASDLGGGSDACTGRSTSQTNVETSMINAISPGGASPLISAGGIDVLHVNHHGSESSTNPTYYNTASPELAIISVGAGQTTGFDLPRIDTVDDVLQGAACVTAPSSIVLQSEDGSPSGVQTSFSGYSVGNIVVTTDGQTTYGVDADGAVSQGANEYVASGLPQTLTIDDTFDLSGWKLAQANATLNYTFPANTIVPRGGYVIVARNATRAQFESFWGVTLGANVVYINSADTMPQLNGSETYTLKDAANSTIDGPTYAHDSTSGDSLERANCGLVGSSGTWTKVAATSATPGTNGLTGCGLGIFINETSDAIGTGNFVYEYVELFNEP